MVRRRLLAPAAALVAVATLAFGVSACGGGLFIGIGDGFDDSVPSVSLVGPTGNVAAGSAVRLVAAAADESGIDSVEFLRFDGLNVVRLGLLGGPPWEWVATVPSDGRTQVQFIARATDGAGNTADSNVLTLAVGP